MRATGSDHYGAPDDRSADGDRTSRQDDVDDLDNATAGHHRSDHVLSPEHHRTRHHGPLMSELANLLGLQDHDVHLDQLRHRRAGLAERAAVAGLEREQAALDAMIAELRDRRDGIARAQKRLEDEVAGLEMKVAAEDKKLYSGTVSAPKELQAIQDEIAALGRRQRHLEDEIIEQMEAAEPLDAQLAGHASTRAELTARLDEATAALRAAEAVIDADVAIEQAARDRAAASVPPGLLAEYDVLRRSLGGVAVARLEGSSCRGCHLQLAAVELERIRKLPADAVVHCEECGRILVRSSS